MVADVWVNMVPRLLTVVQIVVWMSRAPWTVKIPHCFMVNLKNKYRYRPFVHLARNSRFNQMFSMMLIKVLSHSGQIVNVRLLCTVARWIGSATLHGSLINLVNTPVFTCNVICQYGCCEKGILWFSKIKEKLIKNAQISILRSSHEDRIQNVNSFISDKTH